VRRAAVASRATRRGAVMLETLMVNVVLITLLAGSVYFWGALSAKMGALENARAVAWAYAYGGCQQAPSAASLGLDTRYGDPTVTTSAGTNTIDDLHGVPRTVPSTGTPLDDQQPYIDIFDLPGYGTVLATSTATAPGQALLGIGAKEMSLTSHVRCNAIPQDPTPWITAFENLIGTASP
jgi:hypothetical protein